MRYLLKGVLVLVLILAGLQAIGLGWDWAGEVREAWCLAVESRLSEEGTVVWVGFERSLGWMPKARALLAHDDLTPLQRWGLTQFSNLWVTRCSDDQLEALCKRYPDYAPLWADWVRAFAHNDDVMTGDLRKALSVAQQAAERFSQEGYFHFALATAWAANGHPEKAQQQLDRALACRSKTDFGGYSLLAVLAAAPLVTGQEDARWLGTPAVPRGTFGLSGSLAKAAGGLASRGHPAQADRLLRSALRFASEADSQTRWLGSRVIWAGAKKIMAKEGEKLHATYTLPPTASDSYATLRKGAEARYEALASVRRGPMGFARPVLLRVERLAWLWLILAAAASAAMSLIVLPAYCFRLPPVRSKRNLTCFLQGLHLAALCALILLFWFQSLPPFQDEMALFGPLFGLVLAMTGIGATLFVPALLPMGLLGRLVPANKYLRKSRPRGRQYRMDRWGYVALGLLPVWLMGAVGSFSFNLPAWESNSHVLIWGWLAGSLALALLLLLFVLPVSRGEALAGLLRGKSRRRMIRGQLLMSVFVALVLAIAATWPAARLHTEERQLTQATIDAIVQQSAPLPAPSPTQEPSPSQGRGH